jgi:hypothetical protein
MIEEGTCLPDEKENIQQKRTGPAISEMSLLGRANA